MGFESCYCRLKATLCQPGRNLQWQCGYPCVYLDQSTPMVLLLDQGMPATRISMCLKRNLDLSRPNIICLDQSTPEVLLLDHGICTANILDHSIPMVNGLIQRIHTVNCLDLSISTLNCLDQSTPQPIFRLDLIPPAHIV